MYNTYRQAFPNFVPASTDQRLSSNFNYNSFNFFFNSISFIKGIILKKRAFKFI